MDCPHCESTRISFLQQRTNLSYDCFICKFCRRNYNERTGTPFNFVEVPTDIIFEVLFRRVRYKLSYRDVTEFYLLHGLEFTHETVRDWEECFPPYFTEQTREKRRGKLGKVWFVDETDVRVSGCWCYLYHGIDQDGNLVDVRLSEKRDMGGTKAFLKKAKEISEESPDQVFTDGLSSYPRAIDEELGEEVEHQVIGCQGNPVEQSHRGQKSQYYPTFGFGDYDSAQRSC